MKNLNKFINVIMGIAGISTLFHFAVIVFNWHIYPVNVDKTMVMASITVFVFALIFHIFLNMDDDAKEYENYTLLVYIKIDKDNIGDKTPEDLLKQIESQIESDDNSLEEQGFQIEVDRL